MEEGPSSAPKSSSAFPAELEKTVSRGYMEEEADLREAIRRSLLEQSAEKPNSLLSEHEKSRSFEENAHDSVGFHDKENNMGDPNFIGKNATQQNELFCEDVGLEKLDTVGVNNSLVNDSLGSQLKSVAHNSNNKRILINKSCEKYTGSHSGQSTPDAWNGGTCRDAPCAESGAIMELKQIPGVKSQRLSALDEGDGHFTHAKKCSEDSFHSGVDAFNSILVDDEKNDTETEVSILTDGKKNEFESSIVMDKKKNDSLTEPLCHTIVTTYSWIPIVESARNASMYNIDIEQKLTGERAHDIYLKR